MLTDWARTWAVSDQALADLRARLGALDTSGPAPGAGVGTSEAAVQARVRLAASQRGLRLWRNNVGAFHDTAAGVHVRFGLANDSKELNRVIKSGDLIGIRPRVIQQSDVGSLIGQFMSREVKHAGWRYTGTEREVAQLNWAKLVTSLGGDAGFITSESML
jgi:hypothetical protein